MVAHIITDVPIGLSHSRVEAAGGPPLPEKAPPRSIAEMRTNRLTRPVRVGQLSGQPCSLL
jgi:hypothetical protein